MNTFLALCAILSLTFSGFLLVLGLTGLHYEWSEPRDAAGTVDAILFLFGSFAVAVTSFVVVSGALG